ncbi:hypothetical protein BDY21DRAFT_81455 [Lineolata rhizophorae]|uniref:Uncharacterized protein n=1 Tax=Lineolata rhizophorae TaxID=578093 RepID=A0A6A6PCT2_9PEZI|nr:hypothetical protein BDY21DRAFT_81455 [Lineolata rhizophorae]
MAALPALRRPSAACTIYWGVKSGDWGIIRCTACSPLKIGLWHFPVFLLLSQENSPPRCSCDSFFPAVRRLPAANWCLFPISSKSKTSLSLHAFSASHPPPPRTVSCSDSARGPIFSAHRRLRTLSHSSRSTTRLRPLGRPPSPKSNSKPTISRISTSSKLRSRC